MWCMELEISMSDKHYRHYKHTKFCQNLRGSLQFFVNWAWNDPYIIRMGGIIWLLEVSITRLVINFATAVTRKLSVL